MTTNKETRFFKSLENDIRNHEGIVLALEKGKKLEVVDKIKEAIDQEIARHNKIIEDKVAEANRELGYDYMGFEDGGYYRFKDRTAFDAYVKYYEDYHRYTANAKCMLEWEDEGVNVWQIWLGRGSITFEQTRSINLTPQQATRWMVKVEQEEKSS